MTAVGPAPVRPIGPVAVARAALARAAGCAIALALAALFPPSALAIDYALLEAIRDVYMRHCEQAPALEPFRRRSGCTSPVPSAEDGPSAPDPLELSERRAIDELVRLHDWVYAEHRAVLQANAGGEPRWFVDALLDAFDAVNAARIAAQDDLRQGRIGWSGFNRRRAVYNAEHRARREWLWTRRFGVAPPRRA